MRVPKSWSLRLRRKQDIYAEILKNLKERASPEELGFKVKGIREIKDKEFLLEFVRLISAIKFTVEKSGIDCHLVLRIKVGNLDVDPITKPK